MHDRRQVGFSLIELIAVLVILGLMAAIVGPRIINRLEDSKQKLSRVQMAEIENALELLYLDVGRYPSNAEGLEALVRNPGADDWNGPYLKKPFVPLDPWGREYRYRAPGEHSDFDLWALGADGLEGGEGPASDVRNWERQG